MPGWLSRLLGWAAAVVILLAVALGGFVLYVRAHPRMLAAMSRPATLAEMEEIAVALQPQSIPYPVTPPGHFYVTVDGKDPSARLLPRLSHDGFTALPGSSLHLTRTTMLANGEYAETIKAFTVSPWGEASGMLYSKCGDLCNDGWLFVLGKQGGKWVVRSKTLVMVS